MRARPLLVAALALLLIPRIPAGAQSSKSTPANVKFGTLVSLDSDAATLILKPRSGADITYRITEKTNILKAKKKVEALAFKPNDSIVVRFRKSSVGPASLYDLADKPSWDWLQKVRKETTQVTLKEISDEALNATEGADSAEVAYRISEKTTWSRSGKPATHEDFKTGDKVYVVPRLLPSGGIFAVAVSDSTDSAAKLKERSKYSLKGTVKVINHEKRNLNLQTEAGDLRDLPIAEACTVRMNSRDVPLTSVKPGQQVSVRLKKNDEGEQEASRITIYTRKTAPKPLKPINPKKPLPVPKPQ